MSTATKKAKERTMTDAAYKKMLAKSAAKEMANPVTVGENFEEALAACKRNGEKGTYLIISFAPHPLYPESQDPLFDDTITETQMKSLFRFMEQNLAAPSTQPTYQPLADKLADLLHDPQMPEEAARLIDEAVLEFINKNSNALDYDFVRRNFAEACANSATEEKGATTK
jgi:hypothetical protein